MLWSSCKVDAAEALRIGLADYVVPPSDLIPRAKAYIKDLAAVASPAAIRDIKLLVYKHAGIEYHPALREADWVQWEAIARPDSLDGAISVIEKKSHKFPSIGGRDAKI